MPPKKESKKRSREEDAIEAKSKDNPQNFDVAPLSLGIVKNVSCDDTKKKKNLKNRLYDDSDSEEDGYIIKEQKLPNPFSDECNSDYLIKNNTTCQHDVNNINDEVLDQDMDMLVKEILNSNGEWIIGSDRKNISELVKKWKSEKKRPHNDLAFYNIIDITPKSNSDIFNLLSDAEHNEVMNFNPTPIKINKDNSIKQLITEMVKETDFKKSVNEKFLLTRDDNVKEFIWDYAYQLSKSFNNGDYLIDTDLSERMYREIFLTPVINSLFQGTHLDLKNFFGETCLYGSAEDFDFQKNDAEDRSPGRKIDIIWVAKPQKFEIAIGEISGPPNQRCHYHFFDDKIKIAKMLKIMLNRIVKLYGGNSSKFSLLKFYGLQIYDHNAIIYEMSVPFREIYVFREVLRTRLPTNKVNLSLLCRCVPALLRFKELVKESLVNVNSYITDAGYSTPENNHEASLFVTDMEYTPKKETKKARNQLLET